MCTELKSPDLYVIKVTCTKTEWFYKDPIMIICTVLHIPQQPQFWKFKGQSFLLFISTSWYINFSKLMLLWKSLWHYVRFLLWDPTKKKDRERCMFIIVQQVLLPHDSKLFWMNSNDFSLFIRHTETHWESFQSSFGVF